MSTDSTRENVGQPMLILRRISSGIIDHFPIRKSEWGMGLAALGMAYVLRLQPDMFSSGKSFQVLAAMAAEMTWGVAAMIIAIMRGFALGVNGTFKGFGYSPHLRLVASLFGLLFWSQFLLGILIAGIYHGGAFSGVVAYGIFCLFEFFNISQSMHDLKRQADSK